jgi:hypothetical protein
LPSSFFMSQQRLESRLLFHLLSGRVGLIPTAEPTFVVTSVVAVCLPALTGAARGITVGRNL